MGAGERRGDGLRVGVGAAVNQSTQFETTSGCELEPVFRGVDTDVGGS